MSGPLIRSEFQIGSVEKLASGIVPPVNAVTAMTTKMITKISSIAKKMRLISFIDPIPRRLIVVLIATKMTAHNQRGVSGKMPTIDSAANTYSKVGTRR